MGSEENHRLMFVPILTMHTDAQEYLPKNKLVYCQRLRRLLTIDVDEYTWSSVYPSQIAAPPIKPVIRAQRFCRKSKPESGICYTGLLTV